MPVNVHPEYVQAEKEYLAADTLEEKIIKLKKMISLAPSHKGAESLRANLKTRLKKLLEKQLKDKKSKKSSQKGIKKEDLQVVIIGQTNTGKSTLLSSLTNAHVKISPIDFTTKQPIIGMLKLQGINIQLIENPAIGSEFYDKGLTNSADVLLILIIDLNQLKEMQLAIEKSQANKIIVFNNFNLNKDQLRKISAYLQSKKYNFVIINTLTNENIEDLKLKLLSSFNKIRIYTKEPHKDIEEAKSRKPIILNPGSTVKDVAEKILKSGSKNIKETKLWGPSSKFPAQVVGLNHELKDLDVVEFKTR